MVPCGRGVGKGLHGYGSKKIREPFLTDGKKVGKQGQKKKKARPYEI